MPHVLTSPRVAAAALASAVARATPDQITEDVRRIEADMVKLNRQIAELDERRVTLTSRRAELAAERAALQGALRARRARPNTPRFKPSPQREAAPADAPPAAWWPVGPRTGVETHLRSNYGRIIGCVAQGVDRQCDVRDVLGLKQNAAQMAMTKLVNEGYLARTAHGGYSLTDDGRRAYEQLEDRYGTSGGR